MNGMYSYCMHKIDISSIISNIKWCKLHIKNTFRGLSKEKYVGWTWWTHDGLVNDVDGIFQGSTKVFNSYYVYGYYIIIPNVQLTRLKNAHLYEHEIQPTWTPIEPISKDIWIGPNVFHIITRT